MNPSRINSRNIHEFLKEDFTPWVDNEDVNLPLALVLEE